MPQINQEALKMVQEALERYVREVRAAGLSPSSEQTYILHARHFVRWLDDDFEPGINLRSRR